MNKYSGCSAAIGMSVALACLSAPASATVISCNNGDALGSTTGNEIIFDASAGTCETTLDEGPKASGIYFQSSAADNNGIDSYKATARSNNLIVPFELSLSNGGNSYLGATQPGLPGFEVVRINLSGLVVATVSASVLGQLYQMTVEMQVVGGSEIRTTNAYVSAIPIPAALPLFATGVAALAYAGRRKRKAAQAAV